MGKYFTCACARCFRFSLLLLHLAALATRRANLWQAQGLVSVGSVAPMHAHVEAKGTIYAVYAGTTLSTGLVLRYVIGDRLGFESGLLATHYSYYREDHSFGRRLLKGAAEMELADFQIPLVLLHRSRLPKNPHTDVTVSAGTSLDWLATDLLIKPSSLAWLKNVIAGIRFGKEKMKGGKWEYGLEYQYSFDRFSRAGSN